MTFFGKHQRSKAVQTQWLISVLLWAMSIYQQEASSDAGHSASLLGMINQILFDVSRKGIHGFLSCELYTPED